MRSFIACASIIFAAGSAAHGAVIAQNQPVAASSEAGGWQVRDGSFSDAMTSGGSYFWSQAIGQCFTVTGSATVNSIRLWGSSEYIGVADPSTRTSLSSNIAGLQVSIYQRGTAGSTFNLVKSWNVFNGSYTQTLTGTYVPVTHSPIFELAMSLSGNQSLAAGNYMLTVGGILTNGQGDSFAWTDGAADGQVSATKCFITTGETAPEWGIWLNLPAADQTSGAFVLEGTVVPAPGAIALLGIAGARGRGRRRR